MREFSCEWWKIIDAARLFRVHPSTVPHPQPELPTAPTNLHDHSGATLKLASITGGIQTEEAPSQARNRLAAIAAQVHQELFGNEAAGEGDGEREETGMVPVG